ncbi:hypothetical protein ATANTOWER_006702 [Ataeniobius toweri]|uniref:LisH domain-containing protein n=1 Tax=Ataeniobius toweri TaxID=208326 RepID=A0ABU7CBN0_9TELE|nr:hypothetical protein [Ataeniobius toweri]
MYGKGKGAVVPSDSQAREKLALYVYEYLLHVGAQKSAQTFLSEIRWEKNITLGEPPGFLHSWWCLLLDQTNWGPDPRRSLLLLVPSSRSPTFTTASETIDPDGWGMDPHICSSSSPLSLPFVYPPNQPSDFTPFVHTGEGFLAD